jgi:hypothetical protein
MLETCLTRHARNRITARSVPAGVIDIILTYGESRRGRDGARKHALSGDSLRQIRQVFGREIAKAFGNYRTAYVVEAEGRIITVAYSRQPLFS